MGIINVTPNSFADPYLNFKHSDAIASAERMVEEGAKIIDLGGESTNPYSQRPTVQEEIDRVMPVLEAINDLPVLISIDTSQPAVMQEAISKGAHIWNDVRGLRVPGAIELLAKTDIGVIIMHMQGEPENMMDNPTYNNVVEDITKYLSERITVCESAGIELNRICIDPGIGFGKNTEHDVELLQGLETFKKLNCPLLVGASRKKFLGKLTGRQAADRLGSSIAVAMIAAMNGANIIRVHDVKETVDALKMWEVVYD